MDDGPRAKASASIHETCSQRRLYHKVSDTRSQIATCSTATEFQGYLVVHQDLHNSAVTGTGELHNSNRPRNSSHHLRDHQATETPGWVDTQISSLPKAMDNSRCLRVALHQVKWVEEEEEEEAAVVGAKCSFARSRVQEEMRTHLATCKQATEGYSNV